MPPLTPRALRAPLLLLAVFAVALVWVLDRPAPLFVNLGAGDEAFARGFRGDWERDGLKGSGTTQFHWTEDGARLELPLEIRSGRLGARMRLARFSDQPAEVTLLVNGRIVERWRQQPRGFSVREFDLGQVRGPLRLQFRSESERGDPLGIALDWVEVRGAGGLRPAPRLIPGLVALLLGVPLLVAWHSGLLASAWALAGTVAVAAAAVGLDRLGGLLALAGAGPVSCLAVAVLGLLHRLLAKAWPDRFAARPAAAWVPMAGAVLALVALHQPFYFYPDVDTHVRLLRALRANPWLLADPTLPWARRGDLTREIGGTLVEIPYAFVFHALAWPFAGLFGEVGALKLVAACAAGTTLLLTHALAGECGLGPRASLLSQALAATLPVMASRLGLALYPTLLAQAAILLLLVHLARRLPHLEGARDALAAFLFIALAQAVYTGSLLVVGVLIGWLGAAEAVLGDGRRALRLVAAYALATATVLGVMYAGFFPVLWRDVLPHLGGASGPAPRAVSPLELGRLLALRIGMFYGLVYPPLLVAAAFALGSAPPAARRVMLATAASFASLLVLRYALPALFRDAKEIELFAAPSAVAAAAALERLGKAGAASRLAAVGLALALLAWGGGRAVAGYALHFVAAGR